MIRIKLGYGHYRRLKFYQLVRAYVGKGGVGAHPCGARRRVYGEYALACIQEICRIAGYLEGGEGALLHVFCYGVQQLLCGIVEKQHFALIVGIPAAGLAQQLYHHIVGGLVYEGYHHLLAVYGECAVGVFLCGGVGHFPYEVPCQSIRQGITHGLHVGLVYVAGLCGAHEGQGIAVTCEAAFVQETGYYLAAPGRGEPYVTAAKPVPGVVKQLIEGRHHVCPG